MRKNKSESNKRETRKEHAINKKPTINKDTIAYNLIPIKNEIVQAVYSTQDYSPIFNYNYFDDYHKDANRRIEKYKELISEFASKYQKIKFNYNSYDELKKVIEERFNEIEIEIKNAFRECVVKNKQNDKDDDKDIFTQDGLINIIKFVEKYKINLYEVYNLAYEKIRKKYENEFEIYDLFLGAYSTLYGVDNNQTSYYPFNLYFALFTKFIEFSDERTLIFNYNIDLIDKYKNDYKRLYINLNNDKSIENKTIENIVFGNMFIEKLIKNAEDKNEGVFLEKFYYKIDYKNDNFIRIKMPIEIIDYLFIVKKHLVNLSTTYYQNKIDDKTSYLKMKEIMDYITNALIPNIYLLKIPVKLNENSSSEIRPYKEYQLPNKIIGVYKEGDKYVFDITNLEEDDIYDLEPLLIFDYTIVYRTDKNGFIEKYKGILHLDQVYSRLINNIDIILALMLFNYKEFAQQANKILHFKEYLSPLIKELLKHIDDLYKKNIKNIDALSIIKTCNFGNNYINSIARDVIYAKYKKVYEIKLKEYGENNIKKLFDIVKRDLIIYYARRELDETGNVEKVAYLFKNHYSDLMEDEIKVYEPDINEILQEEKLYKTYIKPIDLIIDGFKDNHLIVIGARPSVGKTTIALNIALNNLYYHYDYNIGFISLETSAKALMYRALITITNGNIRKRDMNGNYLISRDELKKYNDYYLSRLKIIDNVSTIEGVLNAIKELKEKYNVKFIIIDYLQRIMISNNRADLTDTAQGVSQIITRISELKKELNIPIIVLAQLNREASKNIKGKIPKMHNIKTSGTIEQEADIILLLDKDYSDDEDRTIICNIDKNRDGKIGIVSLIFDKPNFYFADADIDYKDIDDKIKKMLDFKNTLENNVKSEIEQENNNNKLLKIKESHLKENHLKESHLEENHLKEDHLKENHLKENHKDYDELLETELKQKCEICGKEFHTQFKNYKLCPNCKDKKGYLRKVCIKCGNYFYTNKENNICVDCLTKREVSKMQGQNNTSLYFTNFFCNYILNRISDGIQNGIIKYKNPKISNLIINFVNNNKIKIENGKEYYMLLDIVNSVFYMIFNINSDDEIKNEIKRLSLKKEYFGEIKEMLKQIRIDFDKANSILKIDDENLRKVNYEQYKNEIAIQQKLEKAYFELRALLNEIINDISKVDNIVKKIKLVKSKFIDLLYKLSNYYYQIVIKNIADKNNKIEEKEKQEKIIKEQKQDNEIKQENKEEYKNEIEHKNEMHENGIYIDISAVHGELYANIYNYLANNLLANNMFLQLNTNNQEIKNHIEVFKKKADEYLKAINEYDKKDIKAIEYILELNKIANNTLKNKKHDYEEIKQIVDKYIEITKQYIKNNNEYENTKLSYNVYNVRLNSQYCQLNGDEYNILNDDIKTQLRIFLIEEMEFANRLIDYIKESKSEIIEKSDLELLSDFYLLHLNRYNKLINIIKQAFNNNTEFRKQFFRRKDNK